MATSSAPGSPEWTSLVKKRGLDPLGMQTTSVALYQQLLPGISNVTLRMRYYGFYAWLADWYAKNIRVTDPEQWCRHLRRAEALYALAAQCAGDEHGIPGSRWAGRTLGSNKQIRYSDWTDLQSPDQYLKQKFGAFGAAYGSQLIETRVLRSLADQPGGHTIPVPSPQIGDELASVFHAEAGQAAEVFIKALKAGTVSRSQLEALEPMLPSRIRNGGKERNLYERLLFGRCEDPDEGAEDRTRTLRLVLRMSAEYEAPLNAETVRWTLYAGSRADGAPLQAMTAADTAHAFQWQVYQANDMLHACYEGLLRYSLDVLEGFPQGIPMSSLLDVVLKRVGSELKWRPKSWEALVEQTSPAEHPLLPTGTSEWALSQQVLQANIYMAVSDAETVRRSMVLLALLYKRFRPLLARIRKELPVLAAGSFTQSLVTEIEYLERQSTRSWDDFFKDLLLAKVLDRHVWVAMQKLRSQGDYTFLIEADNGLVRTKQKDGPVFTNPRLGPAITFLEDIHLLGPKGLTARGWALLDAS